MVFCKLRVGRDHRQLPENRCPGSFGDCLPASVERAGLTKTNGRQTKRIVCTLTTESSGGNRLTYEKEHLNLGKTGDFYKTNPSQLPRVGPPALTARRNKWQTDETNHVYVGVKRAAGNRPAYEKGAA